MALNTGIATVTRLMSLSICFANSFAETERSRPHGEEESYVPKGRSSSSQHLTKQERESSPISFSRRLGSNLSREKTRVGSIGHQIPNLSSPFKRALPMSRSADAVPMFRLMPNRERFCDELYPSPLS